MKRKIENKKPSFPFVTPKEGQRFKFLDGYENSEEIVRMKELKKAWGYESYMRIQAKNASEEVQEFQIYVAVLAPLLSNSFQDLIELKTDKKVKVHTWNFWLAYRKAYLEGRKYFKENFALPSEILYGKNGEKFERTLHTHFYHTNFDNFNSGWNYWMIYSPITFELSTCQSYGYYAGLISALNEYKRLHPIMFQYFDKCSNTADHTLTNPIKINADLEELKRTKIPNAFNAKMPISIPIDHFKILFESKNKNGKPYVSQANFIKFIRRSFLNDSQSEKVEISIGGREKGYIISLFHSFYTLGVQYENSSHTRDKYIHLLTDNFIGWDFEKVKHNFKSQNHLE